MDFDVVPGLIDVPDWRIAFESIASTYEFSDDLGIYREDLRIDVAFGIGFNLFLLLY